MNLKKVLLIFNPVAGRSQIRNQLLDIIEVLSAANYQVVCYPTRGRGDARMIARERKDDYEYVICAGGDGTLDEVVSGMMENPNKPFVPIGYIPAGTTHDFASSLHIPSTMRARSLPRARSFAVTWDVSTGRTILLMSRHSGSLPGLPIRRPRNSRTSWGTLPISSREFQSWDR